MVYGIVHRSIINLFSLMELLTFGIFLSGDINYTRDLLKGAFVYSYVSFLYGWGDYRKE